MSLSPSQFESLHEALLSAFPTPSALEQMVRFHLGERLNDIIIADNLRDSVFELIKWTEAHGRLQDLINGAKAANLNNESLRRWTETYEPLSKPPEEDSDISKRDSRQGKKPLEKNKNTYWIVLITTSITLIILYFTLLFFNVSLSQLINKPTSTPTLTPTPTPEPTLEMVFVHRTRSSFLVDAYEVTYDDYQDCVRNSKCSELDNMDRGSAASIIGISIENAKNYCEYREKRLLTVDEWDELIERFLERTNKDSDVIIVPRHKDFPNHDVEIWGIKDDVPALVQDDSGKIIDTDPNIGFRCAMDAQ